MSHGYLYVMPWPCISIYCSDKDSTLLSDGTAIPSNISTADDGKSAAKSSVGVAPNKPVKRSPCPILTEPKPRESRRLSE